MTELQGMDRIKKKRIWTPKRIVYISVSGLFVFVVLYNIIFGDYSSKLNVQTDRLTISTVNKGPFQEFISVSGSVIPIRTIYLDAIEGGWVEELYIESGTFVNKGDSILKLSNSSLLMDIMYRQAEFYQQTNNLRNTELALAQNSLILQGQIIDLDISLKKQKRIYEQSKQLAEKNLIPSQDLDEAKDEYEYLMNKYDLTIKRHNQDSLFRESQIKQLSSSLERMMNNLDFVEKNADNLTLRAPVSGLLTSLNAELGETKSRGERLGQIDILDGFKVRVRVDEHYIARINVGQRGEFTFNNKAYKMKINKIFAEVVNGSFEVDMIFVDKEPKGIRRGQTFRIRLELGDLSEVLLVSTGGFYQKTGGLWVYVLDESGEFATKRDVKFGRSNPLMYEILEGLKEGDRVITSTYDNFGDIEKLILN